MHIHPFRALRPSPDRAPTLSVPPYDVVTTDEAKRLARNIPHSFFYVTRPEIGLPESTADNPECQHAAARHALDQLLRGGALLPEANPLFFAYRLVREGHAQRGIAACFETADYEIHIRTHEKTRPDKEEDRMRHIAALRTHDEPVFLLCRDLPDLTAFLTRLENDLPLYDFVASDGVRHTVWAIRETAPLAAILHRIPRVYIADGHHRAAAAVRIAEVSFPPSQPVDPVEQHRFLAVLFQASELRILPYNRLVRDLQGQSVADFVAVLRKRLPVEKTPGPTADRPGRCAMYLDGQWYALTLRPPPGGNDPSASLDVQMLQDQVLAPILGIQNPRTDPRIEFVGGIHGNPELARRVDERKAAVAFSMHPVTVEQLMAIADAGRTLPPKSTWFEPKLRSGLFLHPFGV